ncbi:hypothetical protein, partial [Thiolapillus sp.]
MTSGELHGFYFEGNDKLKVGMAVDQAGAVDSRGNKYRLDIRKLNRGKWDILLANGQGVPQGQTVTFNLPFRTDFHVAGYLGPTTADDGRELVYFNWAPVQWDEAANQDHYTLKILTPYMLPDKQVNPRQVVDSGRLVLTEPWVNEKYLIDYQRGPNNRLLIVFHKNNPGNRYHMRVQFYLPAGWFKLTARPVQRATAVPGRGESAGNSWLLVLGLAVIGAFFGVVKGKQRSMFKAREGLDEIRWENLDWTPPKLILSEFRKPGKVCKDLTPLEAAFYLEIPFKLIVSSMLNSMVLEGFLKIESESPLRVKVLQPPNLHELDEYEQLFYHSLADDGELSQAELEDLMNTAVKKVQLKAWDADIEATQEYYRKQVEDFIRQAGMGAAVGEQTG